MVEKNIVSDVVDDTSPISNVIIENNRVVGFHYRLCEVDANGTKGKWFEESKYKGSCIIFMGITMLLLG